VPGDPNLAAFEKIKLGLFLTGLEKSLDFIGGQELVTGYLILSHGLAPCYFLIIYILFLRKDKEKKGYF